MAPLPDNELINSLENNAPIPEDYKMLLLPADTATLREILDFTIPPISEHRLITPDVPSSLSNFPAYFDPTSARTVLLKTLLPSMQELNIIARHSVSALTSANRSQSFVINEVRYPFWTVTWWYRMHRLLPAKNRLISAMKWLSEKHTSTHHGTSTDFVRARRILENLQWTSTLPKSMAGTSVLLLTTFCGDKWLTDEHMLQLSVLLRPHLTAQSDGKTLALTPYFFKTMRSIFLDQLDDEAYQNLGKRGGILNVGEKLRSGQCNKIAFSINLAITDKGTFIPDKHIRGNHWVSVVVDVEQRKIKYGDSFYDPSPPQLLETIRWWLKHHRREDFGDDILPCTRQRDTFSCGILSFNAIANELLPATHPLVEASHCADERARALIAIAEYMNTEVSIHTKNIRLTYAPC